MSCSSPRPPESPPTRQAVRSTVRVRAIGCATPSPPLGVNHARRSLTGEPARGVTATRRIATNPSNLPLARGGQLFRPTLSAIVWTIDIDEPAADACRRARGRAQPGSSTTRRARSRRQRSYPSPSRAPRDGRLRLEGPRPACDRSRPSPNRLPSPSAEAAGHSGSARRLPSNAGTRRFPSLPGWPRRVSWSTPTLGCSARCPRRRPPPWNSFAASPRS